MQRRRVARIVFGSSGDEELEQRVRAHGNLVEPAPVDMHLLGATFFVARVAHAQGNSMTTGPSFPVE